MNFKRYLRQSLNESLGPGPSLPFPIDGGGGGGPNLPPWMKPGARIDVRHPGWIDPR